MNGWRKYDAYIPNGILFRLQKEGIPVIYNTDEPGGHHIKWNMPDTKI